MQDSDSKEVQTLSVAGRSSGLTLGQKALILVAIPLVFELVFIGALTYQLHEVERERDKEARAREISRHFNSLLKLAIYALGRSRGQSLLSRNLTDESWASKSESEKQTYHKRSQALEDQMMGEIRELERLASDDPERIKAVNKLKKIVDEGTNTLHDIKWAARDGQLMPEKLIGLTTLARKLENEVNQVIKETDNVEKGSIRTQEKMRRFIEYTVFAGVAANILLAVWLAIYFNQGTTRRLDVLVENTRRLAQGRPLNPPIGGADELSQLDMAFAETVKALNEAEERKQELMSMVTHDLRAPLTSVRGILSLLSEGTYGTLPETASVKVKVADRNLDRLIGLINDLLTIDKLKQGKLDLEMDIHSLKALLNRSADSLRGIWEPRKITVAVNCGEEQVEADGERIVQVVVNLLSNAVKYSPDGGKIMITASEEGEFSKVSITDEGPGIPPEYLERVFERFEQVKGDKIAKKGTGLGLSIARAIVEQHGGKIGCSSTPGSGATFWFQIPRG